MQPFVIPTDVAIDVIRQMALQCNCSVKEMYETIVHMEAFRYQSENAQKVNVNVHWTARVSQWTRNETPTIYYKHLLEKTFMNHKWFHLSNNQLKVDQGPNWEFDPNLISPQLSVAHYP